jgi:hypothetical protein
MALALAVESAVLVIVVVFVVGLLRSHAEILRRLAAVEDGEPAPARAAPSSAAMAATDIAGETLTGDSAKVTLGPGSPTTLLAFLSSGCATCAPLWQAIRDGAPAPAGARLVVLTKGSDDESPSLLRELAPRGGVLMSTPAWADYAVSGSPEFVLVDGRSGRVAGRGTAASWQQMTDLVERALADAELRPAGSGTATTRERAGRTGATLAEWGIGPGHPSLDPVATPGDDAGR